ncbi:hypothetical protein X777_05717 [Ooceraea biroi]|uniref:Uncharacterized protein n=1 Tax=Ooceraea biroi TaxID=2015173 RepID=A0A026WFJ6_OOCBI|nr:hypothetical protein X777_05717 [Ooceraea biroi]
MFSRTRIAKNNGGVNVGPVSPARSLARIADESGTCSAHFASHANPGRTFRTTNKPLDDVRSGRPNEHLCAVSDLRQSERLKSAPCTCGTR